MTRAKLFPHELTLRGDSPHLDAFAENGVTYHVQSYIGTAALLQQLSGPLIHAALALRSLKSLELLRKGQVQCGLWPSPRPAAHCYSAVGWVTLQGNNGAYLYSAHTPTGIRFRVFSNLGIGEKTTLEDREVGGRGGTLDTNGRTAQIWH